MHAEFANYCCTQGGDHKDEAPISDRMPPLACNRNVTHICTYFPIGQFPVP